MDKDDISRETGDLIDAAGADLKKSVAKKTTKAYAVKSLLAVPLSVAMGATPAISQVQARQPEIDPHLPSQTQNSSVEMSRMIVATTTVASANAVVYFVPQKEGK